MNISTNTSAYSTRNYMRMNNLELENAMERLSSGKRINSAGDDAAGLAIVSKMTSIERGIGAAIRNSMDGISLLQTAESALGSIATVLQRIRELAVQGDNGTYNTTDKASLQSEVAQLLSEIDHIAETTEFNGVKLLDGSQATITLHISQLFDDTLDITLQKADTAADGLNLLAADVDITTDAQGAIQAIDTALETVATQRATYGAMLNRINFTIDNLNMANQNITAARSRIEDADMAFEVSRMTKQRVLLQSSISMLSQANQNPQMLLSLLQQ